MYFSVHCWAWKQIVSVGAPKRDVDLSENA